MKKTTTISTLCALAFATACGGAESWDDEALAHADYDDSIGAQQESDAPTLARSGDEADTVDAHIETLHEFEVEGTKYAFLANADDVLLHVSAAKSAPRISVTTTTGERPTFLEIFNALQPDDEPHPTLIASHPTAALQQGRSDTSVLPSHTSRVVEKNAQDLDDCRVYFLGVWGGAFGGTTPIVNTAEPTTAGSTLTASTAAVSGKFMAAGACNFAASVPRMVAFDKLVRVGWSWYWVTQKTTDITVNNVDYIIHQGTTSGSTNLRVRMIEAANNGMQLVTARKQ